MIPRLAFALALVAVWPAQGADVLKGGQIYRQHCAACHGPRGLSIMPAAPSFARGERLMQADLALLAAVRGGRGAMPGYFGILSEREILDVVAYLRTFR